MKQYIIKHRKGLAILAAILFLPALYTISISWIHLQNARHENIFDKLEQAAKANGLLVHRYKQPKNPEGIARFYDLSKPVPTNYGTVTHYIGYKNADGETILPSIYKWGDEHFYEGFANVGLADGTTGFINPDGSWAFTVHADYIDSFFNGRARIRSKTKPFGFSPLRKGFIDTKGNVVVDTKYYGASHYIGELGNEYVLVHATTFYEPFYESLMEGIDINIPPFEILFPPSKAQFLDKNGDPVSTREIKKSIRRLEEASSSK